MTTPTLMTTPALLIVVPDALHREFFDAASQQLLRTAAAALGEAAPLRVEDLSAVDDLSKVQVLVTSWGFPRLDAELLDRMPSLALVAHTGASVRPFITDEVFARGIHVTQAGQAMAPAVAEVSLTFTLALLHRVHRMDHAMRRGDDCSNTGVFGPQRELSGSVVTVIGASRTGRAYLSLLSALWARPLLVDPTLTREDAERLGAELVSLDEGLSRARIVALHAPSLPETRHLIGARELALMPDGAGLVNTARSWLVDEAALLSEVRSGRLDAAIDVFDEEPLPPGSDFRSLPNVLTTPHRAAGTYEGRLRQGRIVAEEIQAWLRGSPLAHAVEPHQLRFIA